jgi:hypothetical protein
VQGQASGGGEQQVRGARVDVARAVRSSISRFVGANRSMCAASAVATTSGSSTTRRLDVDFSSPRYAGHRPDAVIDTMHEVPLALSGDAQDSADHGSAVQNLYT